MCPLKGINIRQRHADDIIRIRDTSVEIGGHIQAQCHLTEIDAAMVLMVKPFQV